MNRNQHFRTRYYSKLGIVQDTAPRVRSPALRSCLKRKPSILHIKAPSKTVSFFPKVMVISIPSHRDYDEETKDRLYNTKQRQERRALKKWEEAVMRDIYSKLWTLQKMDRLGDIVEPKGSPYCRPPIAAPYGAFSPAPAKELPSYKAFTPSPIKELPSYKSLQARKKQMLWEANPCHDQANPNEAAFSSFLHSFSKAGIAA